jgi:hypothetical protein
VYSQPLNIVPLHQDPMPAVAQANLTYRGGRLLGSVKVQTVLWGDSWSNDPNATEINSFLDFIVASSYMDQLAEYSTPGTQIGRGTRIGSTVVPSGTLGSSVQDSDIQSMLQAQISAGTLPAADPNTLYFVYLPDGVAVSLGGATSCSQFCGYHSDTGSIYYAVVPFPSCQGCLSTLTAFEALTSISSHELAEAVTDPIPGQGWYDDTNGEIGDICAWNNKQLGRYTVQLEWSNRQQSCV